MDFLFRRQEFEGQLETDAVDLDLILAYSYIGALLLFVVLWLAIVCGIRWYRYRSIRPEKHVGDDHKGWKTLCNRLKVNLLYAPLLSTRRSYVMQPHTRFVLGVAPPRLAVIVILCILAGNITLLLYRIPWSAAPLFIIDTLRNRVGTIAVVNFIPIMLLASPVNPLIRLLDLSYDSFNLLHRWFARILIAEIIVHAGMAIKGAISQFGAAGFRQNLGIEQWLLCGLLAFCVLIIILIQSWKPLRAVSYEVFLYLHVALVVFAVICVWMHLKDKRQQAFLQAAVGIWILSRTIRITNLIYRSFGSRKTTPYLKPLHGDVCRVTLIVARPWTFKPGQSLYLTIPKIGLITAHPFSIPWMGRHCALSKNGKSESMQASNSSAEENDNIVIQLLVKKQNGFTAKLFQAAMSSSDTALIAYVEGPYGNQRSMKSYASVLLFAGGIGITHMLPYLHEFANRRKPSRAGPRLTLVWVIPSQACFEWVRDWLEDILANDLCDHDLHIDIYATRDRQHDELPFGIRMWLGRPDAGQLVVEELASNPASLAMAVCAGGSLSDDVRKAVRKALGGQTPVHFEEESYGW